MTADRVWVEQVFVVVAKDEVVTGFAHCCQDLAWSGTERCDIPKASDLVDASLTNVLEHLAKSQLVAVNVGNEGDSVGAHGKLSRTLAARWIPDCRVGDSQRRFPD